MATKASDHLKTIHLTHIHFTVCYEAAGHWKTGVISIHVFGSLKGSQKLGMAPSPGFLSHTCRQITSVTRHASHGSGEDSHSNVSHVPSKSQFSLEQVVVAVACGMWYGVCVCVCVCKNETKVYTYSLEVGKGSTKEAGNVYLPWFWQNKLKKTSGRISSKSQTCF